MGQQHIYYGGNGSNSGNGASRKLKDIQTGDHLKKAQTVMLNNSIYVTKHHLGTTSTYLMSQTEPNSAEVKSKQPLLE